MHSGVFIRLRGCVHRSVRRAVRRSVHWFVTHKFNFWEIDWEKYHQEHETSPFERQFKKSTRTNGQNASDVCSLNSVRIIKNGFWPSSTFFNIAAELKMLKTRALKCFLFMMQPRTFIRGSVRLWVRPYVRTSVRKQWGKNAENARNH